MEGEGAVKVAEDVPAANGEEPIRPSAESVQENLLPGTPQNPGDPSDPKPPLDRNEIFRALEVVERDSTAIAESFASLFSSLRLALSEVRSRRSHQIIGYYVHCIEFYHYLLVLEIKLKTRFGFSFCVVVLVLAENFSN